MTIKNSRIRAAAAVVTIAALLSACGASSEPVGTNALTLAGQGSFTVGGTMTTAPGQFDPLRPAAADLEWSTGRGPEARGPGEAVLMAMARRPSTLPI
jgi:hypothetical protein